MRSVWQYTTEVHDEHTRSVLLRGGSNYGPCPARDPPLPHSVYIFCVYNTPIHPNTYVHTGVLYLNMVYIAPVHAGPWRGGSCRWISNNDGTPKMTARLTPALDRPLCPI